MPLLHRYRAGISRLCFRQVISAVLLALFLSSCTSWQVPTVGPEQVIADDHPSKIRVTRKDHSVVELQQPRVVGDTLLGIVKAPSGAASSGLEYRVLLADVATVEVRMTDGTKTGLLAMGLAAAAVIGAVMVHDLAMCSGFSCTQ